ncbi:hypothetical protein PYCC9005_004997 [Savitreella phatthalungensis]
MKQRFSSLDLAAACREININIQDTRLANIYDVNSRTFLLKFAKAGSERQTILIESGYRIHLTDFARETAATPSNFCAKLRKHVRTRRVTSLMQLGIDRVAVMTFGGGQDHADPDKSFHIIFEFYAGGNVILTDGHHRILSLLRLVSEDEGQKVAVGEVYDFGRRTTTHLEKITPEKLDAALDGSNTAADQEAEEEDVQLNALQVRKARKRKDKGKNTVKKVLASRLTQYGSALVEHALVEAGIDPAGEPSIDAEGRARLLGALSDADSLMAAESHPGYIITKQGVYEDFQPFRPAGAKDVEEFSTFNAAVDKFFSSIESQRLEQRVRQQEELASKRLQAAKDEQNRKIQGLVSTQEQSAQKARALEGAQGIVDEAIAAVNSLLEQGMDWVDMERLIKSEAAAGNPVAQVISLPLKLKDSTVTVKVRDLDEVDEDSGDEHSGEEEDDEGEAGDEQPGSTLLIDVDISKSAFSNAREYYAVRRTALTKEEKTQQAAKRAIRSVEQKVEHDLKKGLKTSERALMKPVRKQLWFEKFLWFISSEGYLVLGGHDAQQNEQLYRKHLRKGDVYVHADLNGAASVVVKNSSPDAPIPPSTISQAGTLTVATSSAWDAKTVISAWWVQADQVSKTAPTGEYLTTGSFMIRGKKNFLPPAKLELGYGMLFLVDEVSRDRHVKEKLERQGEKIQEELADKYELEDHGHASEQEESEVFSGKAKHLSAKERRERKRGEQPVEEASAAPQTQEQSAPAPAEETAPASADTDVKSVRSTQPAEKDATGAQAAAFPTPKVNGTKGDDDKASQSRQTSTPPKSKQLTRSQRSKKKKLAKYQDQDDEDKLLAQKLLGIKIAEESEQDTSSEPESKPAQRQAPRRQHRPDVAAIMREENIVELDEDEAELVTPLDSLVSTPLPGDVLIDAIPTCAPYAALQKCKYRCKLQPGSLKKTKALRPIVSAWIGVGEGKKPPAGGLSLDESSTDRDRAWPRERELIKSLKDVQLTSCIGVSKIKVSLQKKS